MSQKSLTERMMKMAMHRLYSDLAYLFPVITPAEHYAEESQQWRQLLQDYLGPGKHRILELGVGGGHNLSHLQNDVEATAVDISEQMLDLSRRLNPQVRHIQGDMRTLDLGEKFRAVLIHDAVSYLSKIEDLQATVETAKRHLDADGMLIMAPDYYRETFVPNRITTFTNHLDDMTVVFLEHTWDPDPEDTEIEVNMFFLLMQNGKLTVEEDRHILGLFSRKVWDQVLTEAGFHVDWIPFPHQGDDLTGWLIAARQGT